MLHGVPTKDFYSPGSLLNVTLRYQEPASLRHARATSRCGANKAPTWDAPEENVVARYPERKVLASGWLLGEKYLTGKAALLDVPMGKGTNDPVRHAPPISRPELPELQTIFQRADLSLG